MFEFFHDSNQKPSVWTGIVITISVAFYILYLASIKRQITIVGPGVTGTSKMSSMEKTMGESQSLKTILLWNSFFRNKDFNAGGYEQLPFHLHKCAVSACRLTRNKSEIDSADALLFHARTMHQWPDIRPEHQLYVFFLVESPFTTRRSLKDMYGRINVTMTYRMDSDAPVHHIVQQKEPEVTSQYKMTYPLRTRKRSVVWVVSRCSLFGRMHYVQTLSKYIDVDIYGKCGIPLEKTLNCTPDQCFFETLPSRYKFYLSFENSFCKDYVTEKLIRTFKTEIIPIVYGGTDYIRDTPPHSVINILDFKDAKALAEYLLYLSQHEEAYNEYFAWKGTHAISRNNIGQAFCRVCEILHNPQYSKTYVDIQSWWYNGTCGCGGACSYFSNRSTAERYDRIQVSTDQKLM